MADLGEAIWDKATDVVGLFRPGEADADGVRVEARALTAAKSAGEAGKRAGSAVKGAAIGGAGAVGARLKRASDARAAKKATGEDKDQRRGANDGRRQAEPPTRR